jgi:hypothetical protein
MTASPSDSGELSLTDFEVRYQARDGSTWTVPVEEIRVIAEFTTSDGPALDDYFLAFVTSTHDWVSAPVYAVGCHDALLSLGRRLGADLAFGLCDRATWSSRVIWPPELTGYPAFNLSRAPDAGVLSRILPVVGLRPRTVVLSGAVERFLTCAS